MTENFKTDSFTIPEEMVKEIKILVEKRQYRSKSDFVREAIKNLLNDIKSKEQKMTENTEKI